MEPINPKILIIEDNDDIRLLLRELLADRRWCVCAAEDGKAGVDAFKPGLFDAVVTDLDLPELNGYQVTKEIRSVDKDIPIILFTSHYEEPSTRTLFERIGGTDGFTKFRIDAMVKSLDRVFEKALNKRSAS